MIALTVMQPLGASSNPLGVSIYLGNWKWLWDSSASQTYPLEQWLNQLPLQRESGA